MDLAVAALTAGRKSGHSQRAHPRASQQWRKHDPTAGVGGRRPGCPRLGPRGSCALWHSSGSAAPEAGTVACGPKLIPRGGLPVGKAGIVRHRKAAQIMVDARASPVTAAFHVQ